MKFQFCQAQPWEVGDCYRACLASLLNLPCASVPHFAEMYKEQESFHEEVDQWLSQWGLTTFNMVMHRDEPVNMVPTYWNNINPGVPAILSGLSFSFNRHSVVIHDGNMYDPGGAGLCSPLPAEGESDGGWWISGVSIGHNFKIGYAHAQE